MTCNLTHYRTLSDDALRFIIVDATEAAIACASDPAAVSKYSDQRCDAATVLHERKKARRRPAFKISTARARTRFGSLPTVWVERLVGGEYEALIRIDFVTLAGIGIAGEPVGGAVAVTCYLPGGLGELHFRNADAMPIIANVLGGFGR